jgi:hypothetical protein
MAGEAAATLEGQYPVGLRAALYPPLRHRVTALTQLFRRYGGSGDGINAFEGGVTRGLAKPLLDK